MRQTPAAGARHAAGATPAAPTRHRPGPAPRPRVADACAALAGLGFGAVLATVSVSETGGALNAPGASLIALGRLAGFTGAYLLLIMVLLIARLPWLEQSVGQDQLVRWHRRVGPWALWLICAHVTFITLGYAQAAKVGVLRQIWVFITNYPDLLAAIVAFGLLIMAGITSYRVVRRKLKYETWWVVHLYTYLGLALAFAHQIVTGVSFVGHPLTRMRETVAIVRSVFTGEKVRFTGSQYRIPLAGGDGRPMRVSLPPTSVPVYLAALSPKMLELTGEIADGWLGTSFVPEGADAYFTHLDAGLARAGRIRADLDICQGAEVNVVDEASLPDVLASRKKELAFSLGGMGSGTSNFYNDAYSRQGWADVAARVRARWLAGDHDGAAALVTDEMVLATTLIGTEDMVRARLQTWRDAGVDTVRLYAAGDTLTARLDNLGRAIDLVRALDPPGR